MKTLHDYYPHVPLATAKKYLAAALVVAAAREAVAAKNKFNTI